MAAELNICPNPVFVVGAPRSGTTIVAWALAQHYRFWTSEESQFLWDLFGNGGLERNYQREGDSWLRKQGIQKAEFREYVGLGLNALLTSRSNGKRWVDHVPVYTLMLPYLADMFPGASFLHILRDGRRVVHSMMHYLSRFPGRNRPTTAEARPEWHTDFREACKTWSRYVNAALDFGARQPSRVLTIINEKLTADPAGGFAKIFQFLEAPDDEAAAKYFRSTRMNSSFADASPKHSVVRDTWEIWRGWSVEQQQIFEEEAGSSLKRFLQENES